jgi:hypothetical protein
MIASQKSTLLVKQFRLNSSRKEFFYIAVTTQLVQTVAALQGFDTSSITAVSTWFNQAQFGRQAISVARHR